MENISWKAIAGIVGIIVLALMGRNMVQTIPAGHVGVVTLFGQVNHEPFKPGIHFPVNPLWNWHLYDVRHKTLSLEEVNVPTQDQLQTRLDLSVQWRIISSAAPQVLEETGTIQNALDVHLVPKIRSGLREQGKKIARAEDFFQQETQDKLQASLKEDLTAYLQPLGIQIEEVLFRNIELPQFIIRAIEQKKEREQAVERQKAELERFRTEQEQTIAKANADLKAAEAQASQVKVLADAKAYEIAQINKAIGNSPLYVQLQALEALKVMSKDPAAKLYFMNGDSPSPLPLMNLGGK